MVLFRRHMVWRHWIKGNMVVRVMARKVVEALDEVLPMNKVIHFAICGLRSFAICYVRFESFLIGRY